MRGRECSQTYPQCQIGDASATTYCYAVGWHRVDSAVNLEPWILSVPLLCVRQALACVSRRGRGRAGQRAPGGGHYPTLNPNPYPKPYPNPCVAQMKRASRTARAWRGRRQSNEQRPHLRRGCMEGTVQPGMAQKMDQAGKRSSRGCWQR